MQSQYSIDYSKCLGKGQFGMVVDCKHPKIKESLCAKIISTDQVDNSFISRESENLMILRNVNNPNLIKMYGVIPVPEKKQIHIIMEKCNQGNLRSEIERRATQNQPYSMQEVIKIVSQIINGYKSLYEEGLIHRNLKPVNILLNDGVIKISDFGMGKIIEDMSQRYPLTKVGTPAYAAPQLFLESTYSSKSDVYSLGIILYQLVFLKLPFQAKSEIELIQFLKQLKLTPFQCEQIQNYGSSQDKDMTRQLINQMLMYNEEERISWEDLFNRFCVESQYLNQQEKNKDEYTIFYNQVVRKDYFGIVYNCSHPQIKKPICIKILKTDQMDSKLINRESEILKSLEDVVNPNLVKIYDVIPCPEKKELHLIMEKCIGENLKQDIDNRISQQRPYTMQEVLNILQQIVNGYRTLFERQIIHRNLKPDDIIIINNGLIKVSNFEMGRTIEDMTNRYPLTKVGTPVYAAPQLFLESTYSSKSDVYSLGIILYQLVFLKLPFQVNSVQGLIEYLKQLKLTPFQCQLIQNQGDSKQQDIIRQLINQMLMYNEEQRISWPELFQRFCKEYQNPYQQIEENPTTQENIIQQIEQQDLSFTEDPIFIQNSDQTPQYFNYQIFLQVADDIPQNQNITKSVILNHLIQLLLAKGKLVAQLQETILSQRQTELSFLNNLQYNLIMTCLYGYKQSIIKNAYAFSHNEFNLICEKYRIIYNQENIQQALLEYKQNYSDKNHQVRNKTSVILQESTSQFECILKELIQSRNEQNYPANIENFYSLINIDDCTEYTNYGIWFQFFYKRQLKKYLDFNESNSYPNSFLRLLALTEMFLKIDEEYPFEKYSELDPKKVYLPEFVSTKQIINIIKKYRSQ